jgi:hypothetical protein
MIDPWHRAQLAVMCRHKNRRINGVNLQVPNGWKPNRVKHPEFFRECTEDQAWELISDALAAGVQVRVEPFHALDGIDCCVFFISGCGGVRIYIKIAHLPHVDKVLGASFHVAEY